MRITFEVELKQKLRAIIKEIRINENVCAKKQAGNLKLCSSCSKLKLRSLSLSKCKSFQLLRYTKLMRRQAQQASCKNLHNAEKKAQKNPCQNDKGDGQKLS